MQYEIYKALKQLADAMTLIANTYAQATADAKKS